MPLTTAGMPPRPRVISSASSDTQVFASGLEIWGDVGRDGPLLPHLGWRGHRVCQFRLEGEPRRAHGGGEGGGARGRQRGTKRAVHRKGTRAGSQARCEGTEARLAPGRDRDLRRRIASHGVAGGRGAWKATSSA